jgi:hypothetical protein
LVIGGVVEASAFFVLMSQPRNLTMKKNRAAERIRSWMTSPRE